MEPQIKIDPHIDNIKLLSRSTLNPKAFRLSYLFEPMYRADGYYFYEF